MKVQKKYKHGTLIVIQKSNSEARTIINTSGNGGSKMGKEKSSGILAIIRVRIIYWRWQILRV